MQGALNSQQECKQNTSKEQYENANPKEAGSPDAQRTQDSDVE